MDLPAVPDYYGQFMAPLQRQQQLGIEQQNANANTQQVALQTQEAQLQAQKLAQGVKELQAYQQDAASVISNPSPEGFRALMLKYPEMHDSLKSAWDQYGEGEKQRDIESAGQLYAALQNGRGDLALQLLQDRKDALSKVGQDDKVTDSLIDLVSSGDPAKLKQAQGMAGFALASATGPDKIGPMLESLNKGHDSYTLAPGDIRYDENGNVIAQSPFIKGADGTLYERDTGATPSTNATAAAGGGPKAAIGLVLGNEGGYNPKDLNGSPTNFGINFASNKDELAKMGITRANFKDMTKDQAEQLYMAKYWPQSGAGDLPANLQAPYFDVYVRSPKTAKRALAQSGGDPAKFMQIASNYFTNLASRDPNAAKYAKAWANRDAGNTAIATGSTAPPIGAEAPSGAPAGYHVLVPATKAPPVGFEADPSKPGALRPIAGGPADTSVDAMDPETVNFYAQEVLAGTPMSQLSFGMGKAAAQNRRQVMEKVAKLAGAEGLDGKDLAIQLAHYKAGAANVKNLETQLGAIQGNERTFELNAQQVLQVSRQLSGQTGIRALNTPVQTYLRQTGDPTVAKMDVAIKTAANEYARLVTSSPNGTGPLTDSARSEYQAVIQGNFPLKQKIAALEQMRIDARNRSDSLRANLKDAYGHLTDKAPELTGRGNAGAKSGPKPGQVVRGYRYKGGNPADPKSWVKL